MKSKTLVILSGGLDSTVLAYHIAVTRDLELTGAVSVNYGQRHSRELSLAAKTCSTLGVPHYLLDLHSLRDALGASSLTSDQPVPEGHYAEPSMKATVVPNRNMILMALAAGVAITKNCVNIAYGAHAGDHAVYPDCREEFASAMNRALMLCDYAPPSLFRPFINWTKARIVARGIELGVNYLNTHTCYQGTEIACGRCGTCVERLEAFDIAGFDDPISYVDRDYWRQAMQANPNPTPTA